jgi:hypothetical protein
MKKEEKNEQKTSVNESEIQTKVGDFALLLSEVKQRMELAHVLPRPVAKIPNYLLWFELFAYHVILNRLETESALRDVDKPIGAATYRLTSALPAELQENLPSIEELEKELGYGG